MFILALKILSFDLICASDDLFSKAQKTLPSDTLEEIKAYKDYCFRKINVEISSHTFEYDANQKVSDFFKELKSLLRIQKTTRIVGIICGKQLLEENKLCDYNIKTNQTLELKLSYNSQGLSFCISKKA